MPVLLDGDTSLDPSFATWTINAYCQLTTGAGVWPTAETRPALLMSSTFAEHGIASCSSARPAHGTFISIQFHAKQLSHNGIPINLTATLGSNHTATWSFPDESNENIWKLLTWTFLYDDTGETLPNLTFTLTLEQGADSIVDFILIDYVVSFYDPNVVTIPTYDIPATPDDEWTAQALRGEHWYLCAKCQFPYPKSETVVVTSYNGGSVRRCLRCVDQPRNDEKQDQWNADRNAAAAADLRDSVKETP